MTPINLEDVESYLVKRLQLEGYEPEDEPLIPQIRKIFAELRAREQAEEHAEFEETASEAEAAHRQACEESEAEEKARAARGDD